MQQKLLRKASKTLVLKSPSSNRYDFTRDFLEDGSEYSVPSFFVETKSSERDEALVRGEKFALLIKTYFRPL